MARRPFFTLLVFAASGMTLAAGLWWVALPLQQAVMRCVHAGLLWPDVLYWLRTVSSPLLLAVLPWAICRGLISGWRQWRATHRALSSLYAHGLDLPSEELRALCISLGLEHTVKLIRTQVPLALCYGVWRPRIWLSLGTISLLTPSELAAVLRHERVHARQRHPLQLLVARSLAAALPFLPVLRELADLLPRVQELAADRAVIQAGERRALGRALLTLVETHGDLPSLPLAVGMVGALDARLDQLTGHATKANRLSSRALVRTWLAFGVGLLLLTLGMLIVTPHAEILVFPALQPLRLAVPIHCVVLLTIICGAIHDLVVIRLQARP